MDSIIGILAFFFVLGVIVTVHEFGHYYFAKRAGILVREFALGMGPQVLKKKKGETVYSLRAFPIGGLCAIAGEEVENDPFKDIRNVQLDVQNGVIKAFYLEETKEGQRFPSYEIINYDLFDFEKTGNLFMRVWKDGHEIIYPVDKQAMVYTRKFDFQIAPYDRTLGAKSKRARAMVMFGGPLMNFLLAFVVFFIAGLLQGFPNYESSQIDNVEPVEEVDATPAYNAGLRNKDIITNLKSGNLEKSVSRWEDISAFMDSYNSLGLSSPIVVTYSRNNVSAIAAINPQIMFYSIGVLGEFTQNGIKIIGIAPIDDNMSSNAQLKTGDTITSVGGKTYSELSQIYLVLKNFEGNNENPDLNKVTMTVLRGDQTINVDVRPYSKKIMETQKTNDGTPIPIVKIQMGISPVYKFDLLKSIGYSGQRTAGSFTAIFDTFDLLFSDRSVTIAALSGFVGIYSITKTIASQGFAQILNWMGLLSVNVGLLNLLPIPALDGGRLLFLGYEAVTKKKPNQKVETALISITMFLLFGLMIYVTINDILRIFK